MKWSEKGCVRVWAVFLENETKTFKIFFSKKQNVFSVKNKLKYKIIFSTYE